MTQIAESRPSPRLHAEARQDLARVRTALAHLPDRQREVIVLHAFAGLEIADIAKALDSNANAVRVSLHHARRRLREILDEEKKPTP
jgi:RNA polymerase sigma-70 factor (ECF subfamily)